MSHPGDRPVRSALRPLPGPDARAPALAAAALIAGAVLVWDPSAAADHPKRALALLGAAVALALLLFSPHAAPPLHRPLALTLGATLAWSAARLTAGSTAALGRVELWVAGSALALALARLGPRTALAAARLAGLLVGLALVAVVGLELVRGARGMALHAGQGNPNWLGLTLVPAAFGALGLTHADAWSPLTASRRLGRVGAGAATAVLVLVPLAQLVAQARTALAATLLVLLVHLSVRRGTARVLAATLALGAALIGARAATSPALTEALGGRLHLWRVSAAAAGEALPWGAGTGSFPRAFAAAQGQALAALTPEAAALRHSTATTAHQDWLEVALELGLPGLLGLAVVGGLVLRALHRARAPEGVAALAALGLAALADSPLALPGPVFLGATWLGVAAGGGTPGGATACAPAGDAAPRAVPAWPVALGLALATTTAALAHAAPAWRADRLVTQARDALPSDALEALERAARLDPHSPRASAELGLARLARGDAVGAEPTLLRASALQPGLSLTLGLGNAALLRGDRAAARRHYTSGLALNPGWFRGHAALALAAALDEDAAAARRHLDVARRLAPGDPRLPDIRERVERLEHRQGAERVAPLDRARPAEGAPAGLPLPDVLR